MHTMTSRYEDSQSVVGKLQKQIKEMQGKLDELEEELNAERQARAKVRRATRFSRPPPPHSDDYYFRPRRAASKPNASSKS